MSFREEILSVFAIDDSDVLGTAVWSMGEARFTPALPFIETLRFRKEPVLIYRDGICLQKSLGEWAEGAVRILQIPEPG